MAGLVERIRAEQGGRIDILVNDIWGGDPLAEWNRFWEHNLANGLQMQRLGVDTHLITTWHEAPLALKVIHALTRRSYAKLVATAFGAQP